jgi:hypothetical protein
MDQQGKVIRHRASSGASLADQRLALNQGEMTMGKTIMHGSFIALLGLGTVGLALAQTPPVPSDPVQAQGASKEVRGDRLDRREAKEHARDHRDDTKEPRRESREGRDETRERHERR